MKINLFDYDFFIFAWLNTSLEAMEQFVSCSSFFTENNYRITRNAKTISEPLFEEDSETGIVQFLQMDHGILMLPNTQSELNVLSSEIASQLNINCHKIRMNIDRENTIASIMYSEYCREKRNFPWLRNENGEVLSSKEIDTYINTFTRSRFTRENLMEYLNKLEITKNSVLEIHDEEHNIVIEHADER